MSHHATSMASKKNPSERFAKIVRRVDNSRDVTHLDLLVVGPILDRKMLYIDVSSAFRWDAAIDHQDCSCIVFKDWCWFILTETKSIQSANKLAVQNTIRS